VVVSPAPPGQTASDALRSRLAAIAAAEGAAEPALPVVRVLRFDPPRGMGVAPIEVEDFPTGLVRAGTARTLAEPLPQLWALRTSRSG